MTATYFPQDDDWYAVEWADEDGYTEYVQAGRTIPIDVITLGAVLLIVIALTAGLSRLDFGERAVEISPVQVQDQAVEEAPAVPVAPPAALPAAEAFMIPYVDYILTQGPHGMSYGHYAIDLAAGNGEPVLSPINGRVSALYVDGIGNPTLVISNEAYEVTMLHGNYSVQAGQEVAIGEQVGTESNRGNTRDMAGNSCRNRDCGYHTHLNVYDKRAGRNVNPLDLLNTVN